jgi:MFS family permease
MTDTQLNSKPVGLGTFYAMRLSGFRLYWLGTLIGISGSWLQITALNWLIYSLTDSPLELGLANLIAVLPVGLLAPFSGVISDRLPPRKLLVVMRSVRVFVALVLALLTLTGMIQIWQIWILMFIGASSDTLELPARYVLLADLVDNEVLSNAIALNAGALNLGRIVGPALAGVLIGWVSMEASFLIVCVLNTIAVGCLWALRIAPWVKSDQPVRVTRSLLEGLRYVWRERDVRLLLVLLAVFSFLAQQYIVVMPVFADQVLHVDARGYGLLMSVSGVSALVGTLIVASLKTGRRGRWLIAGGVLFSCSLALFSVTRWLAFSWSTLMVAGVSQFVVNVLGRAMALTRTPHEFRGRVASFFALFNNGFSRLGGLQAGVLAQYANVPFSLQVGAGLCFLWMACVAICFPSVRKLA